MVLPLGDSITEGYLPSGANGGYRVELFRQAVRAGKNITFVGTQMNGPTTVENRTFPRRHEGRGGYTIAGGGQGAIAGTVTDTAISMYRPNIVLLMIGTNDINGNINVSTAPTRLGQLIDEIIADAPAALVVVATIIPIANDGTNQRIPNYNAAIPGLVATRVAAGKHVDAGRQLRGVLQGFELPNGAHGRQPAPQRRGIRAPRADVLRRDRTALACRALIVPVSHVHGQPTSASGTPAIGIVHFTVRFPGGSAASLRIGLDDDRDAAAAGAAGDHAPALPRAARVVHDATRFRCRC